MPFFSSIKATIKVFTIYCQISSRYMWMHMVHMVHSMCTIRGRKTRSWWFLVVVVEVLSSSLGVLDFQSSQKSISKVRNQRWCCWHNRDVIGWQCQIWSLGLEHMEHESTPRGIFTYLSWINWMFCDVIEPWI